VDYRHEYEAIQYTSPPMKIRIYALLPTVRSKAQPLFHVDGFESILSCCFNC